MARRRRDTPHHVAENTQQPHSPSSRSRMHRRLGPVFHLSPNWRRAFPSPYFYWPPRRRLDIIFNRRMAHLPPRIDWLALMYGTTFYYEVLFSRARSPAPILSNDLTIKGFGG